MEKFQVESSDRKLAEVYLYLFNFNNLDKKDIVDKIVNQFSGKELGKYAGWSNKEDLQEFLNWSLFGIEELNKFNFKISEEQIKNIKRIISDIVHLCEVFIDETLSIFIFPNMSEFTASVMNGCSGFSNSSKTITLEINTKSSFETSLKNTLCHELAHAVSPYYNGGDYTLSEGFILDGIAEHFREAIIRGEKSLWSTAITKEKANEILFSLKDKWEIKDLQLWQEVFFGSKNYPRWAGYSIGYHLIEDYIKKLKLNKKSKDLDWKEIINTPPKKIFLEIINKESSKKV